MRCYNEPLDSEDLRLLKRYNPGTIMGTKVTYDNIITKFRRERIRPSFLNLRVDLDTLNSLVGTKEKEEDPVGDSKPELNANFATRRTILDKDLCKFL